MGIYIKGKTIEIKLKDKINETGENTLVELFCVISAIRALENEKGNGFEAASIKLKYLENMIVTEYINISNLVKAPIFYEFIKFFINIKKNSYLQNTDTKLNINDYLSRIENISQSLIITMVFNIDSTLEEVERKKEVYRNFLKINNMDVEIFNVIKNEK